MPKTLDNKDKGYVWARHRKSVDQSKENWALKTSSW